MRKGAVLIITLWILAILAILSISIGGKMGLELKLTGFYRDSMTAFYLAEAGIKRAISMIKKEDHAIDSLDEPWSNNNEYDNPYFKDIKVGESGDFTVSYRFNDGRTFYGVQDEQGRVNINSAPRDVIMRLILEVDPENKDADRIASDIEDWRDEGSLCSDGSPEYDYMAEGYARKDKRFDSIDEVLLVRGVDGPFFGKMKAYITVYPFTDSPKININTAPFPVLTALGFSGDDAKSIIAYRAGDDGEEGSDDDTPFDDVAFGGFLAKLPSESAKIVGYNSDCFRIISRGETVNKRVRKSVTCVAAQGKPVYWSED